MSRSDLYRNPSSYNRQVSKAPEAVLKNRFIEPNPVLNDSEFSYISRPSLRKWIEVGTGPVRKVFSEPGIFGGDLFVVSETFLYRVDNAGTVTTIGQLGTNPLGDISMAATAPIGSVPAYLYIAEGGVLWCYAEESPFRGQLSVTGAISDTETVELGGVYYEFTSGSVDAGTPDGTVANPWLVARDPAVVSVSLDNLFKAINGTGTPGTTHSTSLTPNDQAFAISLSAGVNQGDLYVRALLDGASGGSVTSTETMANGTWANGATLADGGLPGIYQIDTPDDNGAISLAHINSYIIVVPQQEGETTGRFYWIEPGENRIDPLDFATAERSPDKVLQVIVFNDMFWLMGEKTTEPWLTTGDPAAPMQRYRSVLFDRGTWEGTAVQVKDSLVVVDQDGAVFQISGGMNRISTPQIEERIRKAIVEERRLNILGGI